MPDDDSDDEVLFMGVNPPSDPPPDPRPRPPRGPPPDPSQGQGVIYLLESDDEDEDKESGCHLTSNVNSPTHPEPSQSSSQMLPRSAHRNRRLQVSSATNRSPASRKKKRSLEGGVRPVTTASSSSSAAHQHAPWGFVASPLPRVSSQPNHLFEDDDDDDEDSEVKIVSVKPGRGNGNSVAEVNEPPPRLQAARIQARQAQRNQARGVPDQPFQQQHWQQHLQQHWQQQQEQEQHRQQQERKQRRMQRRMQRRQQREQQPIDVPGSTYATAPTQPLHVTDFFITESTYATAAPPRRLPGGPSTSFSAAGAAPSADGERQYDSSDDSEAMKRESVPQMMENAGVESPLSSPESKARPLVNSFLKKPPPPPPRPQLTVETARTESPPAASAFEDGDAGAPDRGANRTGGSVPKAAVGRAARVIRKDKAQSKEKMEKLENRARAKNRTLDPEAKKMVRKLAALSNGAAGGGDASNRAMRASSTDAREQRSHAVAEAALDDVPLRKIQAAGEQSAETERSTATDDNASHYSTMEESAATSAGCSGGTVAMMGDVETFSDFEGSEPAHGGVQDDGASEGGESAFAAMDVCRAERLTETKTRNDPESAQASLFGVGGGMSVANASEDSEESTSDASETLKMPAASPSGQSCVLPSTDASPSQIPVWWDEENAELAALAKIDRPSSRTLKNACSELEFESESGESDDEIEFDDARLPGNTTFVEHLTKCSVNEEGNPVKEFVVYGNDDGILYDFKVEVGASSIPGAKLGAFLTFIGARRLDPKGRTSSEGERVVKGRRLAVESGIGVASAYVEADYVRDYSIDFDGKKCSFSLGRYGPLREGDRVPYPYFAVKDFVFDKGPGEYAFDVPEKLKDRIQIIDITDDVTGEPHETAKSNVPMYVNEIGHSMSDQNVYHKHERGDVNYYFFANKSMRPGEGVELLTNYGAQYENIRRHQGYGLKNLKGMALSSSESRAAEVEYAFHDRCIVFEVIHNEIEKDRLTTSEIVELLENLVERTANPLHTAQLSQTLSRRQLRSLRRIHWLVDEFQSRIDADEQDARLRIGSKDTSIDCFRRCRHLLEKLKWKEFPQILQVASFCHVTDKEGYPISDVLQKELSEEILYGLRDKLPLVFDPSVWCSVAVDLIQSLCESISKISFSVNDCHQQEAKQDLRASFLDYAIRARNRIVEASSDSACLEFSSGLHRYLGYKETDKVYILTATLFETFDSYLDCSSSLFLDNDTNPKGLVSAVAKRLAYVRTASRNEIPLDQHLAVPLAVHGKFLMCAYRDFEVCHPELLELGALPVRCDSSRTESLEINKTWYIVWQVVFPVHAFASKYLQKELTLETICEELGVNDSLAKFCSRRGINEDTNVKRFLSKHVVDTSMAAGGSQSKVSANLNVSATRMKKPLQDNGIDVSSIEGRKVTTKSRRSCAQKKVTTIEIKSGKAKTAKTSSLRRGAETTTKQGFQRDLRSNRVYEGPPRKPLNIPGGWPKGWTEQTFVRTSGESVSYWFTPERQIRLSSIREVMRFLENLDRYRGDEMATFRYLATKYR